MRNTPYNFLSKEINLSLAEEDIRSLIQLKKQELEKINKEISNLEISRFEVTKKIAKLNSFLGGALDEVKQVNLELDSKESETINSSDIFSIKKATENYGWRKEIYYYLQNVKPTASANDISLFIFERDQVVNDEVKKEIKDNISIGLSSLFRVDRVTREKRDGDKEFIYKLNEINVLQEKIAM